MGVMETASQDSNFPGRYWHKLGDGRIQCDVCPRFCKLQDGKRGFCFVRRREGDQIVLTTYGRSSGFCIDPIEKKPLYHFLPGTPVLSFGTAGCNLGCKFCQNWDISKSREVDTLCDEASPEAIAKTAKRDQCKSVAFTYNDPVIFLEYAIDVAKACHKVGLKTVAVTAGEICPEPREEFYEHMDAANVDLKGFTEAFYERVCLGKLQPVLDTLKYLRHNTNVWLEITTLLIPDENDSSEEIDAMTKWIFSELGPEVPLHFSAYHPDFKFTKPATPKETLIRAREIGLKNGLHHVYTGNVHHIKGDTSYCHGCNKVVIRRDWYELLEYHLTDDGRCKFCGTRFAGVFSGPAGTWGRKRQPVVIREV